MLFTRPIIAALLLTAPVCAQAGDLSGRVHDSRGAPAAGVLLAMAGQQQVSAADGSYAFTGLPGGAHDIAIALEGGHVQRVGVVVPETGEARRTLFLIGRAAIARLAPEADSTPFAEALLAAEQLPAAPAQEWRWRDLEG